MTGASVSATDTLLVQTSSNSQRGNEDEVMRFTAVLNKGSCNVLAMIAF
jgi:hypothetical protein